LAMEYFIRKRQDLFGYLNKQLIDISLLGEAFFIKRIPGTKSK